MEEATHVVHGVSSGVKKTPRLRILRIWQLLAALFGILLAVSIATSGFGLGDGNTLSEEQISKKMSDYINENLLQGQATATVKDIREANGLYLLSLDVNGQPFESYATKDGALFFPQAISVNEVLQEEGPGDSAAETPSLP